MNFHIQSIFFSAITPNNRGILTGKAQTISCVIGGLDQAATIKWIDPDGTDIPDGDSTDYHVDAGSLSGADQTTKLTLKLDVVSKMNSAKTYKCSVSSAEYSGSGEFTNDVIVTPIGELYHK